MQRLGAVRTQDAGLLRITDVVDQLDAILRMCRQMPQTMNGYGWAGSEFLPMDID